MTNGSFNISEIWEVTLVDATGHEQAGTRPVIVIAVHIQARLCTIIPLTSNLDYTRFPYTFRIMHTPNNGLSNDSVALIFQIRSLDFERFLYRRGYLESDIFTRVKMIVKQYLQI